MADSAARQRGQEALERVLPTARAGLRAAGTDDRDAAAFAARMSRRWVDAYTALERLYGHRGDFEDVLRRCVGVTVGVASTRPEALRELDHRREIGPDWFLRSDQVGYVCYVDRFAGTIAGIERHLDYLAELGVTYLHLMPMLQPRAGEADGGYAVADYRQVDERLGTMDDLEQLAGVLRERGRSLCIDLVVNHTAREHQWARRAAAGDQRYRGYYFIYPDRAMPDRYEATLPEVFPDTAPGSFTWFDDVGGWVWTTFHDYQWDLNYGNPDVFVEMLDVMGFLANRGVQILRLDAVPFMWKREGTSCQNQPEAHLLLQAFRALVSVACPAVLFKAEAIVPPGELVPYLGARPGNRHVAECDLAYHNQLMVLGWSSVASRDARVAHHALSRMRQPPPHTTYCTYVRGHDDIGWAVTDEDAASAGWDGHSHRRFLAEFFAGQFAGSFSQGALFQENPDTGDARTCGTTASLCGIGQGLDMGDERMVEQGVRRLLLLYGLAAGYGGIPLVYMGDEIALLNDADWGAVPEQAHDNRWMHRPHMDWDAAQRRSQQGTVQWRVFDGLRRLLETRRHTPQLRSDAPTRMLWSGDDAVLAFARFHPSFGAAVVLANFAEDERSIDAGVVWGAGVREPVERLIGWSVVGSDGTIPVPAVGLRWIVDAADA